MEAGKRQISEIFTRGRIIEIPFFQRAYVWEEEQWERFLEDMVFVSQNPKSYFLGSLILKQRPVGTDRGDVRTLIDGQQRLTTLIIMLKVLWLSQDKDSDFNNWFRLSGPENKLALQHNHNDTQSFEAISNLTALENMSGRGNDKILDAYNFFKDSIDLEKLNAESILARVMFIAIDLWDEDDEQQIFDTINSLGVRLTTAELLKNYFFDRSDLDFYNENWKEVFEKDEETQQYWEKEIAAGRFWRTFSDLFFYAYLQVKVQDKTLRVQPEDKNEFSRMDNLFESYKKLIKVYDVDKRGIIHEIKEYASIFRKYFNYEVIKNDLTGQFGIDRINVIIFGLETTTLIPYTLFILKNVENEKQREELFGSIEAYIMRRMIVRANTRGYNRLFTERMISNGILSKRQFHEFIHKSEDKVNFLPSDQELKKGFHESKLINKRSAGILYFIESKIRNRDRHATQLQGITHYSLEHLMPKKWENNWEKPDTDEETVKRNRKLLTLGNLAIITSSLNISIRDSSWEKKKAGTEKHRGLKHFAASIETLAPYLEKPSWDEKSIEERAEWLFAESVKIWPLK